MSIWVYIALGLLFGVPIAWVIAAAWWHGRYSYSEWLKTREHKRKMPKPSRRAFDEEQQR